MSSSNWRADVTVRFVERIQRYQSIQNQVSRRCKLTQARNISEVPAAVYAVAGDFCRIFAEDMNGLYLLSFLLTANRVKAEQCFVSGLEDSVGANRVFKEWARSWTRRAIIQNAIRMMQPTRERSASSKAPV